MDGLDAAAPESAILSGSAMLSGGAVLPGGAVLTSPVRYPPDESGTATRRPLLRIALLGTRGVPAAYGGFETAVEEVGRRLAARGHEVTVYCRGAAPPIKEHLGMRLVHLPALRRKTLETLSHTAVSAAHLLSHGGADAAIVFNAANAPVLPLLRRGGIPVATHVDGLEWRRAKWSSAGRRYYRIAESMAVRSSDALIADAAGIADYYRDQFRAATHLITYGAPILRDLAADRIAELGLQPGRFHVLVARFEPENHVHLAVAGYRSSRSRLPLVVVGSAPYSDAYTAQVRQLGGDDPRIIWLGSIWDQPLLDQLYAHALTYVHGHSVGGTNPSLLRAMGAGTAVLAFDVGFNREVLGDDGRFFRSAGDLTTLFEHSEARAVAVAERGRRLQSRAEALYRWDDVADQYEVLCRGLAQGSVARSDVQRSSRRVSA